jgi:signal transduction histidine kinase/DNA-binding response OmpR family regulator
VGKDPRGHPSKRLVWLVDDLLGGNKREMDKIAHRKDCLSRTIGEAGSFNALAKIMEDISVLYELSLSVGQSPDLKTNCDRFVATLLARKNFAYASVWIKNKYLPSLRTGLSSERKDQAWTSLIYANPEFRSEVNRIPPDHPILQRLACTNPFSVSFSDDDFRPMLTETGIERGTFAVFGLGDLGFLKLYSMTQNVPFEEQALNQLKDVVSKFAVSLEGCMAHEKLVWEVMERGRVEKALRDSEDRYRRLSKELTIGLGDVFEALNEISSGNPDFKIPEESGLELIADLKHAVNLTADNLGEIVDLSHEFAIGLAEHFDALNRVSKGDLDARVSGASRVELLEALKRVTNHMIESVATQMAERQRAEDEVLEAKNLAEAANRAKGDFLANVSHEIRTPMNAVIGMTDLLLDTELTLEQQEYARTTKASAESLLQLINDILDFSKIEAGKLDLEDIDFDLRTTLDEVTDIITQRAHAKGVGFACIIAPGVPSMMRADPGRLRQVLLNLVSNAVKFTARGEVVVRATVEKEMDSVAVIRFAVSDSGVGICADHLNRLFKAFSQADTSTTRKYGGTGLGLVICKQLVEKMGGKIGVESEVGKGSTFWFEIPVERKPDEKKERGIARGRIGEKRILVVDDDATNREVLSAYLKAWGCRFGVASKASEALSLLRGAVKSGTPYDGAIIGSLMPHESGEILGRQIKADETLAGTSLILLTSWAQKGDAARAKHIGFSAYLTKPIKGSQLLDCLVTVLTSGPERETSIGPPGLVTRYSLAEARGNVRLLLVEDNPVNQKLAVRILEKSGFRADTVNNGKEAVEALQRFSYDLVLMDIQMPEMDGYEATRIIRDRRSAVREHDVPIVAMTAHAMKGDREKCVQAGMNDYVSKPIRFEKLREVVEKYLISSRMRRDEHFPTASKNGGSPTGS